MCLQLSTLVAWPALGLAVMETVNNMQTFKQAAMKRVRPHLSSWYAHGSSSTVAARV